MDSKKLRDYRRNVCAVIVDPEKKPGQVLLFQRREKSIQSWQFPQGGMEGRETPRQALRRELIEETGIRKIKILGRTKNWICYKWPPKIRRKEKKFIGQRQIYFLVKLERPIEKQFSRTKDFKGYAWQSPRLAIRRAVKFKRTTYKKALKELL